MNAPSTPWRGFLPPIAVGAILRLLFLTRQPLWVDEILTLRAASLGEPFRIHDVLVNPQGPLPHVWLRLWTAVAGEGDLALRLWSALAGIVVLVLAAAIFRSLVPRAALLGVWLLALSPFQIWYAQEVRNYIFLLGAAILVMGSFQRALEDGGTRRWLLHGLALAAMLLCNLSGVFLFPALGIALLLLRPRRWVPWTLVALGALAVAAPWLRESVAGHMAWGELAGEVPAARAIRGGNTFDAPAVPYTYMSFVGGYGLGPAPRTLHEGLSTLRWGPLLPGLLAAAAGALWSLLAALRSWREPGVKLLWLLAFLPVIFAAGLGLAGLKAFNPRYVAVSQPAFLLLVAVGMISVVRAGRIRGGVLVLLVAGSMLLGWGRQTLDPGYAREDFRAAAAYLESRVDAPDLVLEQGVNGPLERYYHGAAPIRTFFPVYFQGPSGGEAKLASLIEGRSRIWWVGSRLWYEDPERQVLAWILSRGTERGRERFPGVEVVEIELHEVAR